MREVEVKSEDQQVSLSVVLSVQFFSMINH